MIDTGEALHRIGKYSMYFYRKPSQFLLKQIKSMMRVVNKSETILPGHKQRIQDMIDRMENMI